MVRPVSTAPGTAWAGRLHAVDRVAPAPRSGRIGPAGIAGERTPRMPNETILFRSSAALLFAAAFVAAATLAAAAGVHRVTCKGIHKLSSTTAESTCAESAMLDDAHGRFLPSHSEARADRGRGVLTAAAGGGAIRDVGYGGRDSTSVIIERLRLDGAWQGRMPVEVTMRLRYRFGGEGESRLIVLLRGSAPGAGRGGDQAALLMRYTGLGGAVVVPGETRGRFEQPAGGRAADRAEVELRVTRMVDAAVPEIEIRADLAAHALPNLGSFEESLTSLVHAQGEIVLSAPCPFRIEAPAHASAWGTETAGVETVDAETANPEGANAGGREPGYRC